MKRSVFLLIITLLPYPAQAQDALTPVNFKGIYDFGLSGMRFGQMGIEITQTPERYSVTADIASTGLVRMFSRHSSHSAVSGEGSDMATAAIDYDTRYQTKGKKRQVHLIYRNGEVTEETVEPPENREKRPAVTPEQKKGSADPLSFILRMREGLYKARKKGESSYSINVYDGRRLTKASFTIGDRQMFNIGGKDIPVIVVGVRRQYVAGFTASELEDFNPKEPTLMVLFTDDEKLLPVRLEVPFIIGRLYAALMKECGAEESCLLGISE